MRGAISEGGGNSSSAEEDGRYGEAYVGTKAKAGALEQRPRRQTLHVQDMQLRTWTMIDFPKSVGARAPVITSGYSKITART